MKYSTTLRGREGLKGDEWKTLLQTFFQQEKAAGAPISTECKSGASGGLVGGQFGYGRQMESYKTGLRRRKLRLEVNYRKPWLPVLTCV